MSLDTEGNRLCCPIYVNIALSENIAHTIAFTHNTYLGLGPSNSFAISQLPLKIQENEE